MAYISAKYIIRCTSRMFLWLKQEFDWKCWKPLAVKQNARKDVTRADGAEGRARIFRIQNTLWRLFEIHGGNHSALWFSFVYFIWKRNKLVRKLIHKFGNTINLLFFTFLCYTLSFFVIWIFWKIICIFFSLPIKKVDRQNLKFLSLSLTWPSKSPQNSKYLFFVKPQLLSISCSYVGEHSSVQLPAVHLTPALNFRTNKNLRGLPCWKRN